jgi:hypothetical protein
MGVGTATDFRHGLPVPARRAILARPRACDFKRAAARPSALQPFGCRDWLKTKPGEQKVVPGSAFDESGRSGSGVKCVCGRGLQAIRWRAPRLLPTVVAGFTAAMSRSTYRQLFRFRSSWAAGLLVLLIGLAASVRSAQAATITYDFGGANDAGTIGNTRTFTSGGVTVTASAWAYDTTFQTAALGRWSLGLGVCNSLEYLFGCNSPDHQVDNNGSDEYVLFQFSQAIDPTTISIETVNYSDLDVSYWVGNLALPSDKLAGDTLADLPSRGFGARTDDNFSGFLVDSRLVTLTSGYVTGLLFGAKYTNSDDAFKITSLTIDPGATAPVPEPASMLLLGVGLVGVGARFRRR